jgi:hypothetical protein
MVGFADFNNEHLLSGRCGMGSRAFGAESVHLLDIERERVDVRRRGCWRQRLDLSPGEGAYSL